MPTGWVDSMDSFATNFISMETGTEDLRNATLRIDGITDALEDRARASLNFWTGEAREHYQEAKLRWDAAVAKMAQVLGLASSAVDDSNQNYRRTNIKNTQKWLDRGQTGVKY